MRFHVDGIRDAHFRFIEWSRDGGWVWEAPLLVLFVTAVLGISFQAAPAA